MKTKNLYPAIRHGHMTAGDSIILGAILVVAATCLLLMRAINLI